LSAGPTLILDDGSSGFDIGVGFSTSKSSSKLYLGGGYIHNGRLNVGLDIGVLNLKEQDVIFTSINSKIGYFILRQNKYTMPLNLSVKGNFEYGSTLYSGLVTDFYLFLISTDISHTFEINDYINFIPSGEVGFGKINASIADISSSGYYISLSLMAMITINNFYFLPKINFGENTAFTINIGTVLPRFQMGGVKKTRRLL
jgi:hypothetical protein